MKSDTNDDGNGGEAGAASGFGAMMTEGELDAVADSAADDALPQDDTFD